MRDSFDEEADMTAKICPVCQHEFEDRKHPNRIYCSLACMGQNKRVARITLICGVCGKEFEKRPKSKIIFCSKACGAKGQRHNTKTAEEKRAHRLAYKQSYRETHKQEIKEYNAAYQVEYKQTHREELKAKRHESYANDPERFRGYRVASREQRRIQQQRRNAKKRELVATFTNEDWQFCLKYWRYCCAICGRPQGLWHKLAQDHWIPIVKGGTYTPDNILPLCHGSDGCNNKKYDKDGDAFVIELLGKRKGEKKLAEIRQYLDIVHTATATSDDADISSGE
jgi:hypothetical protein